MTSNLPATIEDVPKSLIDVAETFGFPVVIKLIEEFGGLEVRFPQRPADDHPIIKILGPDVGTSVSHFLTGMTIYIPHARTKSAREEVLVLEKNGMTRSEIARALGISQRHVRRMANATPCKDPNQLDMFPND